MRTQHVQRGCDSHGNATNTQDIHCLGIFAVSYLYGTFCFVGKLKLFLYFSAADYSRILAGRVEGSLNYHKYM